MNKKLRELLIFTILYIALCGFGYLVSKGVLYLDYIASAFIILVAAFISILPYYFFKEFQLRSFLPEFILAAFYSCTRPLLAYITYSDSANVLMPDFDVAQGPLIFASLVFIRIFYNKLFPLHFLKIANTLYIFLLFLFTIPIILNLTTFALFQSPLTFNVMQAILQTNLHEALEYITNLPLLLQLTLPLLLIAIIYALIKNILNEHLTYSFRRSNRFFSIIAFATACTIISYSIYILPTKAKTFMTIISTQQYFTSIKAYKSNRIEQLKSLKVTPNNGSQRPHTIILVIGESAARPYMKAFNESMSDDTTPWLTQAKSDANMLLFNNGFACAHATVPALEHALTEANYYNNKEFNETLSIIDIAKKAGYKTYWFSNQGKIGPYDTPITLVAETADIALWSKEKQYDDILLPYLNSINKDENNFIVFHLYGSHIYYHHRYPQTYQKWTDPGEQGKVADYKNSLLFTDNVLKEIYNYGREKLNMDAMIYLSDHGSTPGIVRNPDTVMPIVFHIPLFVYLSPSYQNEHQLVAQTLKNNTQQYFTNDLLYNLVCGVLDVESNHYDESESLASPKYRFDLTNLKTNMGKESLKDNLKYK
ncbi:phosphoethanolamine transferase [uncultured Phascolarctobacterium sp.]|uniref:phosphoethanolamine transferase n=1 Tax=uncultured Phascolarctobacterium sp. TaxID=512296 RepID=UPI00262C6F48|nr:phosphoethanolamine transferase [uncultured Phascolarctobacterium sp.]